MLNGFSHLAFIGPGGPEILVVMLVLLLMFGAKDAPRIFRKLNEILNQFRSTAENFKREVMYSDLGPEPKPDHSAGEYDDYGVGAQECDLDSDEEPGDTVITDERSSGAVGEADAVPDTGEGEDGDVQKI